MSATESDEHRTPMEPLVFAVFMGLVAAAGELVVLAVRKLVYHTMLRTGPNTLWMVAVDNVLLFAALGLGVMLLVKAAERPSTFRVAVVVLAVLGGAPVVFAPIDSRVVRVLLAIVTIAILGVVLDRVITKVGPRRAGTFTCTFAAAYLIVLAMPPLHAAAVLLLTAGVAARVTAIAERSPRTKTFVRRGLVSLAVLFTLAGVTVVGWRAYVERRTIAALPAAPPKAKNVLLIVWDAVRASSLGVYGSPRQTTPALARMAEHGVTFDWAYATAPWTLPSHASMFTGRFAHEMTADFSVPFDDTYPVVAERFTRSGFVTAGIVGNTFYGNVENGLARGFAHYEDFVISPEEFLVASSLGRRLASNVRLRDVFGLRDVAARRSADDISAAFLEWVDGRPSKPFFAFLNYYDAHEPFLPPEPWLSKFGKQDSRKFWRIDFRRQRIGVLRERHLLPPVEQQAELDAYDGSIAYMDDRLGLLLDSLERRGLLRNTIVVVTSDHGEHHGEHPGVFGHNASLFTQEVRVPLVVRLPDATVGSRVTTPVSIRDLATTFLDLAGVAPDTAFPGRSLSRYWRASSGGVAVEGDTVLSEYPKMGLTSVASGPFHLIRKGGATVDFKLFNVLDDPEEQHDLSKTAQGAAVVQSLGDAFRRALEARPPHGK